MTYHYTESGLNKIYLANGYEHIDTEFGKATTVHNPQGLHDAIGLSICQKSHITGAEFRFLRKELDLSQSALGKNMGITDQAIAKWEKTGKVPKTADRFIRLIYLEKLQGNVKITELLNKISELDRKEYDKMLIEETATGWQLAA